MKILKVPFFSKFVCRCVSRALIWNQRDNTNGQFIGLCRCTGISRYMQVEKFQLVLVWSTNLDWFQFIAPVLMQTAWWPIKKGRKKWQKRSTRDEGGIWSSHTTSSAHLQLYENSDAKTQLKMFVYLQKSQPVYLPNSSCEILSSTSMVINVKLLSENSRTLLL
jgi:hypothetical protein